MISHGSFSAALFLCNCYRIIINYTRVSTINHIRISSAMGNKQTNKVDEAKIRKKKNPKPLSPLRTVTRLGVMLSQLSQLLNKIKL